jgi:predicted branched-subunit amino acid permease
MAAVAQAQRQVEPASIPAGLRAILPVLPAAFVFGASFGLLAGSADVGGAATTVMSLTTFAGSAQFAAVAALKAGGGGLLAGIVAAVFLNLRYLPIGLSVAEAVPGSWWQRLLRAQLVVDESWALGQVAPGRWAAGRLLGAGLGLFVCWNLGTLVGSLGGSVIGDPDRLGLDAAFPALFAALLAGQLRDGAGGLAPVRRLRIVAAAGALIALVALPVAPNGLPIVVAALAIFIPVRWTDR